MTSSRLKNLGAALVSLRDLIKAERDSLNACERKGALPVSASRAQSTTLEARWARAAEHRDRLEQNFIKNLKECGYV